jgi:hypothetical protein
MRVVFAMRGKKSKGKMSREDSACFIPKTGPLDKVLGPQVLDME